MSAILTIIASALAVGRSSHEQHKVLRLRGGDVIFRSGKGLFEPTDNMAHCGKSKQSVMRFAPVAVLRDAGQDNFNNSKPFKKSYQYYF